MQSFEVNRARNFCMAHSRLRVGVDAIVHINDATDIAAYKHQQLARITQRGAASHPFQVFLGDTAALGGAGG